jgi:hypothetical protein
MPLGCDPGHTHSSSLHRCLRFWVQRLHSRVLVISICLQSFKCRDTALWAWLRTGVSCDLKTDASKSKAGSNIPGSLLGEPSGMVLIL